MSSSLSNPLGNNGGRFYSFNRQPVWIDCNFIVDSANTNGLGTKSLKGTGVQSVVMQTSSTPATGNPMVDTTSAGLALVTLKNNYVRYVGGIEGRVSPLTGSNLAINATALTPGLPYVITSVGVATKGAVTIAPVADSSGSLAGTYFTLPDAYGNIWAPYLIVNGVGVAPSVPGATLVPIALATNATADNITTALSTAILGLLANQGTNPSAPAVAPFTESGAGGATLTLTSTNTNPQGPLPGAPQDGSSSIQAGNTTPLPIIFTISSGSATAGSIWTDGQGGLWKVSTTLSSGTSLLVSGTQLPINPSGTLTFVSGTGSSTALTYSAASAALATGFTFAATKYNSNLENWQAVGLPKGIQPAVGVSFVATASGQSTGGGSTGLVSAVGVSGVTNVEVIGDADVSLAPIPMGGSPNVGGQILMQFLAPITTSGSTVMTPTAPADGSGVVLGFWVEQRV